MDTLNIQMTETEARLLLMMLKGEELSPQEKRELFDVENFIQDSLNEAK